MADLYPHASWEGPVPNKYAQHRTDHKGIVLHHMEGTESGTNGWFHNPQAQASADFGIGKDGRVEQYVKLDSEIAWAQVQGNPYWISVELEGYHTDDVTPAQVEAVAQLYAWTVHEYGVPFQQSNDPVTHGLGWHGMGGADWGSHFDCPGEQTKAARMRILARAQAIYNADYKGVGPFGRPPAGLENPVWWQGAEKPAVDGWHTASKVPGTTRGRVFLPDGSPLHFEKNVGWHK